MSAHSEPDDDATTAELVKLADSKLGKVALAGAAKEIGELLTDTAKGLRLFALPITLLAKAHDRLRKLLDDITDKVPPDKRQEASASIAGPILQNYVFIEDDTPLASLYRTLLQKAIDKEQADKAHPAFVRIIEQLHPDEALIVFLLSKRNRREPINWHVGSVWSGEFPTHCLANAANLEPYLYHLKSLTLLKLTFERLHKVQFDVGIEFENSFGHNSEYAQYMELSSFGRLFAAACIPDDFPCPPEARTL